MFSPTPRSHYLNITPNNVVRLYTKGESGSTISHQTMTEFVGEDFIVPIVQTKPVPPTPQPGGTLPHQPCALFNPIGQKTPVFSGAMSGASPARSPNVSRQFQFKQRGQSGVSLAINTPPGIRGPPRFQSEQRTYDRHSSGRGFPTPIHGLSVGQASTLVTSGHSSVIRHQRAHVPVSERQQSAVESGGSSSVPRQLRTTAPRPCALQQRNVNVHINSPVPHSNVPSKEQRFSFMSTHSAPIKSASAHTVVKDDVSNRTTTVQMSNNSNCGTKGPSITHHTATIASKPGEELWQEHDGK